MAQTHQNYLQTIRDALDASLNLRYLPSQEVERQSHPEIEFRESPKLLMNPIVICRNEQEGCLIEGSINSVRISFSIKKGDVEGLLTHMLQRFFALRADRFKIMRRIPADKDKYDFSFLITEDHLAKYKKEDLINFILEFMQGIDKEISEMKLAIINQSRIAASFFTNSLANNNV